MSPRIDLFLGSDLGAWVLGVVDPSVVRLVITLQPDIRAQAESLGLQVVYGNANTIEYSTAGVGLSVHYQRLLRPPLLAKYDVVYNLHPGYLPWGRGYYPVFWALWEGTPAGPTLHVIDPGIDEGPIVDQTAVPYTDADTGGSLFDRVRVAEKALFRKYWPVLLNGDRPQPRPQHRGGTYHSRREFVALKETVGWEMWRADLLVKLIRCLTIPQYPGWCVALGGRRFELKVSPVPRPGDTPASECLP